MSGLAHDAIGTLLYPMSLITHYEDCLSRDGLSADPYQHQVVQALERVAVDLRRPRPTGWKRWLGQPALPVKGLYIWGGVGRGKTWLMDLFHDQLGEIARNRLHFHHFMRLVHQELSLIRGQANPLQTIAARMARDWRLLCLDEFNVVDIGDAMILAGLLRGLLGQGVVLVTTSNVVPDRLYLDGIQRASFLPAIDLLNAHTQVVELGGDHDYRKMIMQQARSYHTPIGAPTEALLQDEFERLASAGIEGPGELTVNGRAMPYRCRAKDMVWFDFETLCGPPRSQNDYIELARCHQTVFLSDIPIMGGSRDDRTRRFIFLIDEFYDRRVKLVVSAEASPDRLYIGERLAFEFRRTVSRLSEMQTPGFLGKPHLG